MTPRVLAVEDESNIRDLIRFALEREDHDLVDAANTQDAWRLLQLENIDLAIIDWMLPGGSGIELIRQIRREKRTAQLPIIMLTARTEERDIAAGLDAGADDYLTKPFSPRELQARVRALLRRSRNFDQSETLEVGPMHIDLAAHRITVNGTEVALGHTEFNMIVFLARHPQRVYSRAQLLDQVWGPNTFIEERTVDVHVLRIRKALKPVDAEGLLQTVRGAGYRLVDRPN
jgi:two-component system phosphate regulon response regulator PhoB